MDFCDMHRPHGMNTHTMHVTKMHLKCHTGYVNAQTVRLLRRRHLIA